ncbi:hypothetical protein [Hymenobacter sp. B81]|uniref:hypothetical protein n=1 Tax=Hymenobacter sp. B81 TaxID=3344878 RepID=UPI0037DD8550
MAQQFPAPYYRIVGNKAVAVYGNYVEEILENRRRLRAPIKAWNRRLEAKARQPFRQAPPRK